MRVAYHAKSTPTYYICNHRSGEGAGAICQSLAGGTLEALVVKQVLRALKPAAIELRSQAVADLENERQQLDRHWQRGWNGRESRPNERRGNTMPSSRKTAWWPASWSGAGNRPFGNNASWRKSMTA